MRFAITLISVAFLALAAVSMLVALIILLGGNPRQANEVVNIAAESAIVAGVFLAVAHIIN